MTPGGFVSVEYGSAEVSTLRERIAAQIDAHGGFSLSLERDRSGHDCYCGHALTASGRSERLAEWQAHVADAVAEALDLTEEQSDHPVWVLNDPPEMDDRLVIPIPKSHIEWKPMRRWVSSWSVVGDET